jgi:cytochrome c oxidase subunit 2
MKLIGWAIALAAAGLTPAAAQAPQASAASPQASPSPRAIAAPQVNAAAPTEAATPAAGETAAQAVATGNTAAAATPAPQQLAPTPGIGAPVPGGKGIQTQVTAVGEEAAHFHNFWLMITITVISIFVLALLLYVIVRYRRGKNPEPSRTAHNTVIEVVWTLVPVLILVLIAVPSIRLLRHQYSPPPADLTVKVIGQQWYWTYEYPDNGGFTFDSYMLKEKNDPTRQANQRWRTDVDGPPLLAADERMVIPAGKVVKLIITSDDVIHSFGVPAFWAKLDANPGTLNETWVKVDRPGVYFGVCSELCGARHCYMPIAVEVLPEAQYAQWVASKGGTMAGAKQAPTPATLPATTAPASATPAVEQPAINQAATAQN